MDYSVAAGAVVLPVWQPWLHDFSVVASELAPILGLAWFAVKFWDHFARRGDRGG